MAFKDKGLLVRVRARDLAQGYLPRQARLTTQMRPWRARAELARGGLVGLALGRGRRRQAQVVTDRRTGGYEDVAMPKFKRL